MLIKMFADKKGTSPEARAKTAMVTGGLMLGLGAAGLLTLVLLEAFGLYPVEQEVNSYAYALLCGLSGGIIGGGFAAAFTAWQRLRDPEKMRQYEIKAHDERNLAIQNAAAKMTLVTAAVGLYLMLLASAFFRPELSMLLLVIIVGLFGIYALWLFLYTKRM